MRHVSRHLVFAMVLFVASGVLLSGSASGHEAHIVNQAIRTHVHPGMTRVEELINLFGEPVSRQPLRGPGESEVLGYSRRAIASSVSRFAVLPRLIPVEAGPPDVYFEITDGVVMRSWTH